MGITGNCAKFLFYAKQYGASFERTLTLGRQHLYADARTLSDYFRKYLSADRQGINGPYADDLFIHLGAARVDSIDISDFEGATIVHDLNVPVPDSMHDRYTLVFDGGTLEHIFNFPVAIRNLMNMLMPGGHLLCISPANNQCGHGFYQFSPELFYSILTPANGFCMRRLFFGVSMDDKGDRVWYEVQDPARAGSRVTLQNSEQTYILLIAEKLNGVAPGELKVFQSDYVTAWNETHNPEKNEKVFLQRMYGRLVSKKTRDWLYKLRHNNRLSNIGGLGVGNPAHFVKIDF